MSGAATLLPSRRRRVAAGLAVLTAAGAVVWIALGMHRGLLLSSDIKSKCWPWAPYAPAAAVASPALSDPVWQFVPWLELARRELRAGRLPLWNPHQDGGVPLLGNSQSALGSPMTWPVLLLGAARGWNLSLLARVLLALGGAFLWLRDRGRSRAAAALGAAAFGLSGAFVAWLEHPQTLAAAPVPLVLLFATRVAEGGRRGNRAALAGATALVLVGGHPETALMAALLTGALLLALRATARGRLAAVASALLGLGLAAPFVLPFLEYFALSEARAGVDRHPFVLPLTALARFVLPHGTGSIEESSSVSLAVLALVPFGLAFALRARRSGSVPAGRPPHDREALFWAAAALASLAVVYENPLSLLLARATPIYWTRALLVLPLALGFLAALGLDGLLARAGTRTAGAVAGLLVAISGAELLLAARGVHAVTPPALVDLPTPLLSRLGDDRDVFRVLPLHTFLPPNSATTYGLDDVRGYDALAPRGFRRERDRIGRFGGLPTVSDAIEPWHLSHGGAGLDFWNVKYLLLHPQFRFGAETLNARLALDLAEEYSGPDGVILRNRRVLPRARVDPRGAVELLERTPQKLVLSARLEEPGEVVVANPYFPGWTAFADGRRVPLDMKPGEAFRVPLGPGAHHVELRYRPRSLLCGFLLGLVSFALVLRTATARARA